LQDPIVIVHFHPLAYYPPVQNLLNFISEKSISNRVYVITTKSKENKLKSYAAGNANISIHTYGSVGKGDFFLWRYFNYGIFYFLCFLKLIRTRPRAVLYFETLSSFPSYLYKRFVNKGARILIHYHEYASAAEYEKGMKLERVFHKYEKLLFPFASWVSHTNKERMQKFQADISPVTIKNPFILPNYPPLSWAAVRQKKNTAPYSIVYAGALGMDTMYIKEFAVWVENQNGLVEWDIYSQQDASQLMDYLLTVNSKHIHFRGCVDYSDLPAVLGNYNVGVILYKGHIDNYIYNAPNKLFEYLAAGLDVWFPVQMLGCMPYCTNHTYPKVVPVDFDNLRMLESTRIFLHNGMEYFPSAYYCEMVLPPLIQELAGKD
jgi:hypothetical protein